MSRLIFIGDVPFTKILSGEFFKVRLGQPFSVYPVSTMSTFRQYQDLLPEDARCLVVGCLPALLAELKPTKLENREVTLSECFVTGISFLPLSVLLLFFKNVLWLSSATA